MLPLFCAALMALDITASTLVKVLVPASIVGATLTVLAAAAGLAALIAAAVLNLQAHLFSPRSAGS